MKILARPRRMGKTTELIKYAAKTDCYMVVRNRDMAHRAVEEATQMGLHINFPLTFEEFLKGQYQARNIKGFLIDDAEHLFLRYLQPIVPIVAITVSNDEELI